MQAWRYAGEDEGMILELYGGVGGATEGLVTVGKDIVFCERDESQFNYASDRLSNLGPRISKCWGSPIVLPWSCVLVHREDMAGYSPDDPSVRVVPHGNLFEPVPASLQRDWDRLYGGAAHLLVNCIFFLTN